MRCPSAPQPLTNPSCPRSHSGRGFSLDPLSTDQPDPENYYKKYIRQSLGGSAAALGIRLRNRVLLTCNVQFRAQLKTVEMLRRAGGTERARGWGRPWSEKGQPGRRGSRSTSATPPAQMTLPGQDGCPSSREDWSHVPVRGCPGVSLSPPAPTGEQ